MLYFLNPFDRHLIPFQPQRQGKLPGSYVRLAASAETVWDSLERGNGSLQLLGPHLAELIRAKSNEIGPRVQCLCGPASFALLASAAHTQIPPVPGIHAVGLEGSEHSHP